MIENKGKHIIKLFPVFLIIVFVFAACQTKRPADALVGLVVVKAPVSGVITKVLVSEGAKLGENAGIVEIETSGETTNMLPEKDLNKQSTATVENAQKEVERASVEVERVQSLITLNSARQTDLDAARADFQRAQEKLQTAQMRKKAAKRRYSSRNCARRNRLLKSFRRQKSSRLSSRSPEL